MSRICCCVSLASGLFLVTKNTKASRPDGGEPEAQALSPRALYFRPRRLVAENHIDPAVNQVFVRLFRPAVNLVIWIVQLKRVAGGRIDRLDKGRI
jgi:hypothetical protein